MNKLNWRTSSHSSGNGGECIEVASLDGAVAVRDTKQNDTGPMLRFTPAVWRRFAYQLKQSLAAIPTWASDARSKRDLYAAALRARSVMSLAAPPGLIFRGLGDGG